MRARKQRVTCGNDEFYVKVARTWNETCKLVKAGFEYVTNIEDGKPFESENNVLFVQENMR